MATGYDSELHGAGLRITAGRVALLEALESSPHSDAETLRGLIAGSSHPLSVRSISVQSVHNVLGDLTAAGLIRRIEPAGSAARYERRLDDNHHHIVCTGCGIIADVDCVVGHAPCLHPSDAAGFSVSTAEVTFWGVCSACQASPPAPN